MTLDCHGLNAGKLAWPAHIQSAIGLVPLPICSNLNWYRTYRTSCTKVRTGSDSNRSIQQPLYKMTKMTAEFVIIPWINKFSQQSQQESFSSIPAPALDVLLMSLVVTLPKSHSSFLLLFACQSNSEAVFSASSAS